MGYTHYWTSKEVSKEQFAEFVSVCKKLRGKLPKTTNTAGGYYLSDSVVIKGWDGTGKPQFDQKGVGFNGDAADDLDHETFLITPEPRDSFCKTARKPYDLLVTACLIAAYEILKYDVSSDGKMTDWKAAFDYYKEVTGVESKLIIK